MKKFILFLFCFCLPLIGYAKYCPSCFDTFQTQTPHGKAVTFYDWLIKSMNPKYSLKKETLPYLFDPSITIVINGHEVARGLRETYHYLYQQRQQNPIIESHLRTMLADKDKVAIAYETISGKRHNKHRALVISILEFKNNKLSSLWSVVYDSKINS